MLWLFALIVQVVLVSGRVNETAYRDLTVWQALRSMARSSDHEFIGIARALDGGSCSAQYKAYLDDPNETVTIFAPTDKALMSFFPDRVPLRYIGCSDKPCQRDALQPLRGSTVSVSLVQGCLPGLLAYHIVPGLQFIALDTLRNASIPEIVTVLPTFLNATFTDFVKLNQSQVLIVNQTRSDGIHLNQYIHHGTVSPAARIVYKNIRCLNGIIQGIDTVLIPPADAFRSLYMVDPNAAVTAFRTPEQASSITGLSNITMFWPVSGWPSLSNPEEAVQRSISQLWNYTQYVVEGAVLYNNQSQTSFTITMINGTTRNVSVATNYSMTVDGIPMVASNILMENGVLHLLARPFAP